MYCYLTDELSTAVAFVLLTIPITISPSCKYEFWSGTTNKTF